jgi:hypothetical protein
MKLFVEIDGQDGHRRVVGEALEKLRKVCNPKRGLEAGANFVETLSKTQRLSFRKALSA